MTIAIGRSFVFTLDRIGLLIRLPWVGQLVWSRGVGLYVDGWSELKRHPQEV